MVAITAVVALIATAKHDGPSDAAEHGLRLHQPGSASSRGVRLHVARVAARVERIRGLRFESPPRVRVMSAAELAALGQRLNRGLVRRMREDPGRLACVHGRATHILPARLEDVGAVLGR